MPTVDFEAYLNFDYDGGKPFDVETLLRMEDEAGIDVAVVMPANNGPSPERPLQVQPDNLRVAQAIAGNRRCLGCATINPTLGAEKASERRREIGLMKRRMEREQKDQLALLEQTRQITLEELRHRPVQQLADTVEKLKAEAKDDLDRYLREAERYRQIEKDFEERRKAVAEEKRDQKQPREQEARQKQDEPKREEPREKPAPTAKPVMTASSLNPILLKRNRAMMMTPLIASSSQGA